MNHSLFPEYTAAFSLYVATLLTSLLRMTHLSRLLSVTALVLTGSMLVGITISSGLPPIFDGFSGLMFAAFILGALGSFVYPKEGNWIAVRACVWVEILLLFGIALFFPKAALPHSFQYANLWVILFHGARGLALSFAMFAAAHFISFRMKPEPRRGSDPLFGQGRNFLLLAALLFLCGEYAGIIWCQNGWGDIWHWSSVFFQSTLIILCFMFAFHIPGKNACSNDLRAVIAMMTPLFMLAVAVIKWRVFETAQ